MTNKVLDYHPEIKSDDSIRYIDGTFWDECKGKVIKADAKIVQLKSGDEVVKLIRARIRNIEGWGLVDISQWGAFPPPWTSNLNTDSNTRHPFCCPRHPDNYKR